MGRFGSLNVVASEIRSLAESSDDAEVLYQALQEFDRMTIPLAEHAVAQALKEAQQGEKTR